MRKYFGISVLIVTLIFGLFGFAQAINRINLSQVQASFVGEDQGDALGGAVSLVGDVNGDGHDDILIGASWNDYNGDFAGQVYFILGQTSEWQMRTSVSEADASFVGEEEWDGVSNVSIAGDVNGDGYNDILISAPDKDWREKRVVGQTYLIFGKSDGWEMRTDLSQANASFIGEIEWAASGISLSGGDVNGDGYDDILIGAAGGMTGGGNPGWTYLIFGRPDGWRMRTKLSLADASFVGENAGDAAGMAVSVAGDINGDGYNDILIGAYDNDYHGERTGQVYLIFGQPAGWEMGVSLSEADASFVGEGPQDDAGISVASPGDVNGDGHDDILIGASRNSDGGEYAGQAYLIFGKPDGWSMHTPLSQADASFIGEREWEFAGDPVAGAGDVNRDGYDDILIGAPASTSHGEGIGRAYLIFGKPGVWRMRTPLSEADVSFEGEEWGDLAGSSVAGDGDVNGDGYDDILIGAYFNNYSGEYAGQAYLSLHIPVTITTATMPYGSVGIPYTTVLSATRGTPPYFWSLSSGSPPDGVGLDSTGVISGVPTSVDTADFTVKVADAASDTNAKAFTIIIREIAKGDVNGDGQINIVDVVFAVNITLELYDPTPTQRWAADCDDDGTVNIQDIICMINIILEGSGCR
ncbi:MAG: dockerin type I domain-containing protein [bacterium]